MNTKKSSLLIVFLTICIDLIGFGIIIPLSPYLARHFNASGLEIGLLMFTYAGVQLCFSPIWGHFSDLFGRRPILVVSLLGSAVAHLSMAFASSLWMLFFARALAGFFGASISVATAYIADVTHSTDRAKNMGIIGAAFGLGFVLGPAISGTLSYLSVQWGFEHPFAIAFPALGASFICFANFIFAYFKLPESKEKLSSSNANEKASQNHSTTNQEKIIYFLKKLISYTKHSILGKLLLAEMLLTIGMGQMEATLALFLKEVFSWSVITTSFAYVYIGLVMVFSYGYLIRKLMPIYGEKNLLLTGIIMSLFAMLIMGLSFFMWSYIVLLFGVTLLALGNGIFTPALLGAISLTASQSEQGRVMGIYQSYMSIGRMIGAVLGGFLFDHLAALPYFSASFVMLIALILIIPIYSQLPNNKLNKSKGNN